MKQIFILIILIIGILRVPVVTPSIIEKDNSKAIKEFKLQNFVHLEIQRINTFVNNYEVSYHSYNMSLKYGVPVKLILSIIKIESEFKNVVSKTKNRNGSRDFGYMQVNNVAHPEYSSKDLMKPETNIEAGTKYLSYCLKKANGNTSLAVKMYNAGVSRIQSGVVPASTQKYAMKVMNTMYSFYGV